MTKINPHIFRAYDIRGKAISDDGTSDPDIVDLSKESVYLITRGIATYIRRKRNIPHDQTLHVVVGRDCRLTGAELLDSMIKALKDTNCRVANIDLATSPLVYYSSCKYGFDLGLVLTASHNHKNDNGIKIVEQDAHSVCGPELQGILKIVQEEDFEVFHEDIGESYIFEEVFDDYTAEILEKLPLGNLEKPLKIAVDTGNGVAGMFIGRLLRGLGCEVIELYGELDGNYPNHEANPEYSENLKDLMKTVQEENCDIGFGFDGDGDRIGVINEKGEHYAADQIVILLARDILSRMPGAKIVFDVKCSLLLEAEIKRLGGIPLVEKTGHSFIESRMRKESSPLAGEVSGHIFIGEDYYGFDDAMFVCAKIIKVLASARQKNPKIKFSNLLSDLPKTYTTPELKVPCPDNEKFEIVERVTEYFKGKYPCVTIDGVKVFFSETEWGIVRCSNTSACLTLRFEADSEEGLKRIYELVENHLKEYPSVGAIILQS
ncbi:phosphomannomutase/phosphoglucomutase [Candidatus Peregrinibacteria bacterium]|nr:phosphomannomutase/phosphoglucomutase [Candidatus Peregrinibacteria bacterium]